MGTDQTFDWAASWWSLLLPVPAESRPRYASVEDEHGFTPESWERLPV